MLRTPKIVVAVHGIGEQLRNETVRHVAWRFASSSLLGEDVRKPALGHFHPKPGQLARAVQLPAGLNGASPKPDYYFAEVYWADIASKFATEGRALEETKAWAWSVIWRARARGRQGAEKPASRVYFDAGHVIEDIVEAIRVLGNLTFMFEKAGVFRFDLGKLLRDFVGDVQLVADFEFARAQILTHFEQVMSELIEQVTKETGVAPEIHIVAHSEGTVVSFLALQRGLRSDSAWTERVRQYMTIGSPLDIHHYLWREIFPELPAAWPAQLKWTNYYDFGDPIALGASTTREWARCPDANFEEIRFGRYPFPGAAHNGYWLDAALFEHFFDKVANRPSSSATEENARKSSRPAQFIAYGLPFGLVYALHSTSTYVLLLTLDTLKLPLASGRAGTALAMGGVLLGMTAAARLPYLIPRSLFLRWLLPGVAAAGSALGAAFIFDSFEPRAAVAVFAVVAASWLAGRFRQPRSARRWLLGTGALAVVGTLGLISGENAWKLLKFWPTVLTGGASFYLWWLGLLLFELTVVWHQYIRREKLRVSFDKLSGKKHRSAESMDVDAGVTAPASLP